MTTTIKMPEPVAWLAEYGGDVYTAKALRDVLEQAAQMCDEKHWTWRMGENSGPKECADSIRAMIGEIK